jgi:pyridoxamine 5'-phosphate oxidase
MAAMSDPAQMRRGYLRGHLDESDASRTWLEQFRLWFHDATSDVAQPEPTAMQLATASASGRPSVRTVLLKGLDERGVVFYTNYESAKAADLAENPIAAAVFAWLLHERQVRFSGRVTKIDRAETEQYFALRPRGSQLGAWVSPQSQVISSRSVLEDAVISTEARFAGQDVPPPPNWGGYRLEPETVEFWQGRADRLHDRLRYRRDGDLWILERLAP